jgi:hypothetical protein
MRNNASTVAQLKRGTAVRHLRQGAAALDDEVRLARALEAEAVGLPGRFRKPGEAAHREASRSAISLI